MDVFTLLGTLARQWRIIAVVMALTAVVALLMVLAAGQPYRMDGTFLVGEESLARTQAQDPAPDPGGVAIAPAVNSSVIADAVRSGDVVEQLRGQQAAADYEVNANDDLLRVVATSANRDTVVPTVTGVIEAIGQEVQARQEEAGVPEAERVEVETLAEPNDASVRSVETPDGGERYRAFGSVRLQRPGQAELANPYAEFGFSIRVIEEVLYGDKGRQLILDAGGARGIVQATSAQGGAGGSAGAQAADGLGYRLSYDPQDTAPVAHLTVTGSDAQRTQATFNAVREVISTQLDQRQASLGIDPEVRTGFQALTVFDQPQPTSPGLARPLIIVVGLGAVIAVGLALLRENVASTFTGSFTGRLWRRGRQVGTPAADGGHDPGIDGTGDGDDVGEPDPARRPRVARRRETAQSR